MNGSHTPGPWISNGHDICPEFSHGSPCNSGIRIATTYGIGDEHRANANLIAAAPELLQALESLYRVLIERDGLLPNETVAINARHAIAKAIGAFPR